MLDQTFRIAVGGVVPNGLLKAKFLTSNIAYKGMVLHGLIMDGTTVRRTPFLLDIYTSNYYPHSPKTCYHINAEQQIKLYASNIILHHPDYFGDQFRFLHSCFLNNVQAIESAFRRII